VYTHIPNFKLEKKKKKKKKKDKNFVFFKANVARRFSNMAISIDNFAA
jgi:hypothetical protein